MSAPLYFDYAATCPVDPRVAAKMAQCLTREGAFGNPGSRSHRYGWQAEALIEEARSQLADALAADPREIVFTSGATESNNLAIKGVMAGCNGPRHIITSELEHKAVLDVCAALEAEGVEVTYLAPNAAGAIEPDAVAAALRPHTRLVSLMLLNNELGTITDIASIGRLLRKRGVLLHTDAAQAAGKLALRTAELHADLVSLSAHKCYGPKGVGALFVRRAPEVNVRPLIHGGGQERGLRPGTLATHQIVGFGAAIEFAEAERAASWQRLSELQAQLWAGLEALGNVSLNGGACPRAPHYLNVSFGGVDGEALLIGLRNLAVSTGSACTSASVEPSHVLRALKVPRARALASIRFSFGRWTEATDIDVALTTVRDTLATLRGQRAVTSILN